MTLRQSWPKRLNDPDQTIRDLGKLPEFVLRERGEKSALALFHAAAEQVPAYRDFLRKEGVSHKKIKTIADFKQYVPIVDKKNYLTQYPLPDLCWKGDLFTNRIISVSSGSSGTPLFWPRGAVQDTEGGVIHEDLLRNIFSAHKHKTLFVICFSMGTWIAGSFTTASALFIADKGYPINIITPGLEKSEAIRSIRSLAPNYDQIIIAGYPPFVKDIVDEGQRAGIRWGNVKTRFIMAGEAFSEEWRDYLLKQVGSKDPYFDSINIYGSADAAILGHETPASILARRIYNRRTRVSQQFFDTQVLPSVVQYRPQSRYFEAVDEELVFTAASGIPLIRYNIKDTGAVLSFEEAIEPIKDRFYPEAERLGIDIRYWCYPFVYLKGRRDFTVTIYAVNIYPENIKAALIDRKVRRWTTGRFTMATKYYSDMDQYFEVNIELAKGFGAKEIHRKLVQEIVVQKLRKLNAEFQKLYASIGNKALPHINLVESGNEHYFARGVKHKWVKKGE